MRSWKIVPLLALALLASGCYTTVVETGRAPSHQKFRDEWVMGFASGLIMPERVHAARRCLHGVARVKTEQSLQNFAVQTVTAGLLSPRTVEVTCAAGPWGVLELAPGRGIREMREMRERRELREMKRMDHFRTERHRRHERVVRRFHVD